MPAAVAGLTAMENLMTYAQENMSGEMSSAPLPAGAPAMIDGGLTGETAVAWLSAWGYNAELATGAEGSPRIRVALNGASFDIAFFTGSEDADGSYESLQLIALFELDAPIGLERINDWNTESASAQPRWSIRRKCSSKWTSSLMGFPRSP